MSRSGQPRDSKTQAEHKSHGCWYFIVQVKLGESRELEKGTWTRNFRMMLSRMEVGKKGGEVNGHEKNAIGMVVIRGNSVVTIEPLEIQV
ncbi:hypothetical protein JHK84_052685 [Glycine max]|nr:hypothetical protein JHK86_052656 [Glycine max]KAG5082647.1 hypothetical protein JHK84_052685 [Glycine max]